MIGGGDELSALLKAFNDVSLKFAYLLYVLTKSLKWAPQQLIERAPDILVKLCGIHNILLTRMAPIHGLYQKDE